MSIHKECEVENDAMFNHPCCLNFVVISDVVDDPQEIEDHFFVFGVNVLVAVLEDEVGADHMKLVSSLTSVVLESN